MRKLVSAAHSALQSGPIVLVSVIASSGSTPRGAGAMMLVRPDGSIEGTIGGGAVEFAAQKRAADIFRDKRSETVGYNLAPNDIADLGMICGGDVTVYFQYVERGEPRAGAIFAALERAFESCRGAWLLRRLERGNVTGMDVLYDEGALFGDCMPEGGVSGLKRYEAIFREGAVSYYVEPVLRSGKVFIFGGGHVARALVPILSMTDFNTVVFEDRPEFCKAELFPGVSETILGDFTNIAASIELTERDYAVIITRGHQKDYDVLKQALRTGAGYIGCIGSRVKMTATKERLLGEGFGDSDIERIVNPIGLAIKAETPAEIGVSIAAELILKRTENA